jgi:hypothetical protein
MPPSLFGSLRATLGRRRPAIAPPRMRISTHRHWLERSIWLVAALLTGAAIAVFATKMQAGVAVFEQKVPGDSQEKLDSLRSERDRLSATVNAAESQLTIERSAQKQLVMQVKSLTSDNVKLKEDLAFFESLLPTDGAAQGVSIRRLKAEAVAPNQLRYQLLIMQGGKVSGQFTGNVQLAVSVVQAGKNVMLNFPDSSAGGTDKFKLAFKYYQRLEGILTLPDGVSMKSLQARILNNGQVRTQLSTNL